LNRLLEIEFLIEDSEVIRVGVPGVAVPSLGGTTVPSPVSRDNAVPALAEK